MVAYGKCKCGLTPSGRAVREPSWPIRVTSDERSSCLCEFHFLDKEVGYGYTLIP